MRAKDFLIVHGVDHARTGKATYANASLYAVQHLAGVAAVSSKVWHGSAARYLPNHPLVDKLDAYKLSRACEGEEFCLEVPDAPCPNGIAPGSLAVIAFRAYLEPSSSTAPDPSLSSSSSRVGNVLARGLFGAEWRSHSHTHASWTTAASVGGVKVRCSRRTASVAVVKRARRAAWTAICASG